MPDPSGTDARTPGPSERPAIVVALGASAGGIAPLQLFLRTSAVDTGAAFVVILHLSPEHESHLAEVLQSATSMPVSQVRERTALKRDHVYVTAPNQMLESTDGVIEVHDVEVPAHRRAPIDVFFRTLADVHGSRAVAVVLSGTGPDGSAGIKRVKENGGLVIAQLPDEAQHKDMPLNAIRTGVVDLVLPVAVMPGRILAYQQRTPPEDARADEVRRQESLDTIREILTILRAHTGNDFSNYKPSTVLRRIDRRLQVHSLGSVSEYGGFLREHPEEAVALMKDLLISVTSFFRDRAAFEALEHRIIPRVFEGRLASQQVRVWIAACATGEEAYSIAMLLAEFSATMREPPAIQVFASDLDERAIGVAREGLYTEADLADVSEERLRRFFAREGSGYRVRRELRELVLFARHNVIKDPPFSHLDLISCRNLLIYLNRTVQDHLLETFQFALRPGGFLFLGASESADGSNELFVPVDAAAHIYESRTVTTRPAMSSTGTDRTPGSSRQATREETKPPPRITPAELHYRMLEELAAPSVVVTEEMNVVHVSERAGRYLQVSGGEPSRDLYRMLRPDLRTDVRNAVRQAVRQRRAVTVSAVRTGDGSSTEHLDIGVRPVFRDHDPARGYLLILFSESAAPVGNEQDLRLTSPTSASTGDLEEELGRTKAALRATIEQYEMHVEEAKASNEELQAMNEELRSSAEELETSKEELQSVNEELTTVNQELKIKIEELALSNNDIRNLINATDLATVFLDRQLRVKMSTPRAQDVFNLRPGDTGRPLSDITTRFAYGKLHDDVRTVLETLRAVELEAPTIQGRWYEIRIRPYRTVDDRIEGIVIILQDITERRETELRVRANEERLRVLIDSAADYAIFTLTLDGRVDSWNVGAQRMFGFTAEEIVGKPGSILYTQEDRGEGVPERELSRALRLGRADDVRWHVRKDGTRFFCSGVMTRLGDADPMGFAKIARDLTTQRDIEKALKAAQDDVEARVPERTDALTAEIAQRSAAEESVTGLFRRLVTAQEDERARIARDLHDQLGQQLTALRLLLERHEQHCSAATRDDIERALALSRQIDEQIGFLAWELRPAALDDLGLGVALPQYLKEWSEHYGIHSEFRTSGYARGQLAPEAEVAFYRVGQEALNNVLKHAQASRVDLMLETRDGSVVLLVEDNGVGFDVGSTPPRGVGLLGMRERAAAVGANLDIESRPGGGTTVFLRCPVLETAGRPIPR